MKLHCALIIDRHWLDSRLPAFTPAPRVPRRHVSLCDLLLHDLLNLVILLIQVVDLSRQRLGHGEVDLEEILVHLDLVIVELLFVH